MENAKGLLKKILQNSPSSTAPPALWFTQLKVRHWPPPPPPARPAAASPRRHTENWTLSGSEMRKRSRLEFRWMRSFSSRICRLVVVADAGASSVAVSGGSSGVGSVAKMLSVILLSRVWTCSATSSFRSAIWFWTWDRRKIFGFFFF